MKSLLRQLQRLQIYTKGQLDLLDNAVVWPPPHLREAVSLAFWWMAPASFAVYLITRFKAVLPFAYLDAAIWEGFGPHLWQIFGLLGLALFGLVFLLPGCKFLADSARQILLNVCGMGWLACGLALGLLVTRIPAELSRLVIWKARLSEAVLACMLFAIIFVNGVAWWLASLMHPSRSDDEFIGRIRLLDLRFRIILFLCFSIFPTVLFVIRGK